MFSRLSTSLLRQGSGGGGGGGDRRTTTATSTSRQGALQSATSRYECPFGERTLFFPYAVRAGPSILYPDSSRLTTLESIAPDNEGYCHRHPHVRLAKKKVGDIPSFSFPFFPPCIIT